MVRVGGALPGAHRIRRAGPAAFSGWVPLGGVADALALTPHPPSAFLRIWSVKPRRTSSFHGKHDHDWDLRARRYVAGRQDIIDAVLAPWAAGPERYGGLDAAPAGLRSAPAGP